MFKPSFSTVACPNWTLARVAQEAARAGFLGVELRTFGDASREFACEPALTDSAKVRRLLGEHGVEIVSLGTSAAFDKQVWPPVMGNVFGDNEEAIRLAKRAIDLAVALECPLIRVFGYQIPGGEKRKAAVARIVDRLKKVVDHADRTGVKVAVENGGSFNTAAELRELIDAVSSPLLGAAYNIAAAHDAGESPVQGLTVLGDKLLSVKLKDLREGKPVLPGQGTVPMQAFVKALVASRFSGPAIYEWDRAWMPQLAAPEQVLPVAARTIFQWIAEVQADAAPRGATLVG